MCRGSCLSHVRWGRPRNTGCLLTTEGQNQRQRISDIHPFQRRRNDFVFVVRQLRRCVLGEFKRIDLLQVQIKASNHGPAIRFYYNLTVKSMRDSKVCVCVSVCGRDHLSVTPHSLSEPAPPTITQHPCVPSRHPGPRGMQARVGVSRSSPSVGMRLRGPGSSGNAEMTLRSRQTSRKKEGGLMVVAGICRTHR